MCTYECFESVAPKTFLRCFNLRFGAIIIALIACVVMVICVIATAVQVSYVAADIRNNESTSTFAKRNSYAYSIIAVVYSLLLLVLSIWFLFGIYQRKTTLVLAWVVVFAVWLGQLLLMLLVLIYLHSLHVAFLAWLFALIFGILVIGILTYFLLVVLGYWFELKRNKQTEQS